MMDWFKNQTLEEKIKDYGEMLFSMGQEKFNSIHLKDMIIEKDKMLEIILADISNR